MLIDDLGVYFWKPVPPEGDGNNGAGDGDGKPVAFDPEAFSKTMMAEFNRTLNGAMKTLKGDFTKSIEALKPLNAGASGDENANGGGDKGGGDGKGGNHLARLSQIEAANKALLEKIDGLNASNVKERGARLEVERLSAVNAVLNTIKFRDPASRELFFKSFQGDVTRDDEGNIIAVGDDRNPLTIEQYLTAKADALPHLMAPKGDGGGSGNKSGSRNNGAAGAWVPTLDDLDPAVYATLSADKKLAIGRAIVANLGTK